MPCVFLGNQRVTFVRCLLEEAEAGLRVGGRVQEDRRNDRVHFLEWIEWKSFPNGPGSKDKFDILISINCERPSWTNQLHQHVSTGHLVAGSSSRAPSAHSVSTAHCINPSIGIKMDTKVSIGTGSICSAWDLYLPVVLFYSFTCLFWVSLITLYTER